MIRNLAYSLKQSNAIFRNILLTTAFFVSFIFTAYSQKIVGGQLVINLPTTVFGDTTKALLSLPGDYDSTTTHYPLIVFLHGSGEAGTVIDTLLRTALPMRIADGLKMEFTNPKDKRLYKYIVVSPQAPSWSYQETHVKCMLPVLISRYRIDTNRIYITGLSAGGYGTWTGITDDTAFCKKLAAIVPISAATLENYRTPKIKNAAKYGIPVWEICGTADAFYDSDKVYVDTYINKNRPVIPGVLTSLVGVGHSAWDQGYDPTWSDTTATGSKMNVYQWMLQYTRGGVPDTSGTIIGCGGKKRYIIKGGDKGSSINGATFSYSPGDTLTFKFSSNPYSYFNLTNIHGTPTCPVTITNEGGQAKMSTGMSLLNCTYIKIAGTGSIDKYGFRIEDTASSSGIAINISGRSSNIEINNIDVHKKVYGVVAQQVASCADSLQYPNWRINNLNIHDNRIIKTKWEGIYLGSNDPNGTAVMTCSGKSVSPKPLRLSNITIKNNIIDSTNRSGIQLCSADSGTNNIDSNQISDIGLEFASGMGNGITLGGYTTANVYDNSIANTYYNGIQALGVGLTKIDSNTITNSGREGGDTVTGVNGIYVDTRNTSPVDSSLYKVIGNSISGYTGYGIRFYKTYNTYGNSNLICGNTGTLNIAPGIRWSNCSTSICGGQKRYIIKGGDKGSSINGSSFSYSPGDTLTFKFSSNPYSYFNLTNIHGTPTCPVTITNEGGQAKMSTGMSLLNCTYIKIAGTGSIDK
ncbi:MAG TPA: hypothetical protein VN721_09390, partial [Flavipsychrobacter sp.]|nr:hypothetical protein [Flavipsychrobacter sp.]